MRYNCSRERVQCVSIQISDAKQDLSSKLDVLELLAYYSRQTFRSASKALSKLKFVPLQLWDCAISRIGPTLLDNSTHRDRDAIV